MSRLEDLGISLTDMTREQVLEHIRQIRSDRKISKTEIAARRKTAPARKKQAQKDNLKNLLEQLTPSQKLALLAKYSAEE